MLTEFSELIDPDSCQVGELIVEQTNDKSFTGAFVLFRDRDRWLTAFVCMGRLLEFVRTHFGLKNAFHFAIYHRVY